MQRAEFQTSQKMREFAVAWKLSFGRQPWDSDTLPAWEAFVDDGRTRIDVLLSVVEMFDGDRSPTFKQLKAAYFSRAGVTGQNRERCSICDDLRIVWYAMTWGDGLQTLVVRTNRGPRPFREVFRAATPCKCSRGYSPQVHDMFWEHTFRQPADADRFAKECMALWAAGERLNPAESERRHVAEEDVPELNQPALGEF